MKRILYFTAAWCGPCKAFKPVLQEVTSNLGIQVQYVDVDSDPQMVEKYGITSVPTMFVFSGETLLERRSGAMSKDQLKSILVG
jgi:thioredoxin 1